MFASAGTRGGRKRLGPGTGAWDGVSVLQLGSVDSDVPVSMTLRVPSVLANTIPNATGPDFIIDGAQGTGSAFGGSIIFQTCPNGPAGVTRNGLFERVRISPLGTLLVNQSSDPAPEATQTHFSVSANGAAVWGIDCFSIGNNASPAGIIQLKTRGTTASSNVAVISGDTLGGDYYDGNDGTNYVRGATMLVIVDGTVSTGFVPSRIELHTTSTTATNVERMRITSVGNIGINNTAPLSFLDVGGPLATTLTYSSATAVTLAASNSTLVLTSTQTVSLTLGQASSYPGRHLSIKNVGGQTVNSTGNVTPIGSTTPGTTAVASGTGKFALLQSDGTNWITIVSN